MSQSSNSQQQDFNIAVIGAGPQGIAAGHELLKQGFKQFTIFEKETAPGGTWHMHSYPGLACDVWAHSYTFSYAPNHNWSASFVNQPEIEAYLQRSAEQFGLTPHLKTNTRITTASYQEASGQWLLTDGDGNEMLFDAVINAMGNQHTPVLPNLKGMDSFKGPTWHSTEWNHDVDLSGKRVTLIGSAAAAVQIVPELAKTVGHLTILQRSPNWVLRRNRKIYSNFTRSLFNHIPFYTKVVRAVQGFLMSYMHEAALMDSKRMGMFEEMGLKHIEEAVDDPELRKVLTPASRFGCKRPLVSDDFYPALNRDNVTLIASGASEINENSVITADGHNVESDVIIYCTGYRVLDYDRIDVKGKDGLVLAECMEQSTQAYKGIAAKGFPNYFMGMGPNAIVLSVSYFKSIEANVAGIVSLLSEMRAKKVQAVDVNESLNKRYNEWIAENCVKFSWGSGSCKNYYTNADGQSPFLFPADYKTFLKMRQECTLEEFEIVKTH